MDKLKRYVECYIDTETCNFKCHYCYIALLNKFNKKIVKFSRSPEEIRNALSKESKVSVNKFTKFDNCFLQ